MHYIYNEHKHKDTNCKDTNHLHLIRMTNKYLQGSVDGDYEEILTNKY